MRCATRSIPERRRNERRAGPPQTSSLPPGGTGRRPRGAPMPQPYLLDAKQLQVSFGGHTVVHGVDFALAPGEKLALVGESGSGKTVTALSLLRLVPDARVTGQALFQGRGGWTDLVSLPERDLRAIRGQEIAMIFQEPMTALNPLYTVGEQ